MISKDPVTAYKIQKAKSPRTGPGARPITPATSSAEAVTPAVPIYFLEY